MFKSISLDKIIEVNQFGIGSLSKSSANLGFTRDFGANNP
jgi:hypothetical protein